jgi:preprotein translocase subunit SecD
MARMSGNRSAFWPALALIIGIMLVLVALPNSAKQWAPAFLRAPAFHFGLDLAGGTQLDFRISERELEEQKELIKKELDALSGSRDADRVAILQLQLQTIEEQQRNLIESIRTVLERRINAMGVSEAVITPSYVGDEKHLLVDCPGVVNVQECIDIVGKTITLEFKEEFDEPTEEFQGQVRAKAQAAIDRIIQRNEDLKTVGEDLSGEIGLLYQEEVHYFREQIPRGLEELWNAQPGIVPRLIEGAITVPSQAEDGSPAEQDVPGIFIAEILAPRSQTGKILMNAEEAFAVLAANEEGVTSTVHEEQSLDDSIHEDVRATLRSMQPGELVAISTGTEEARALFLRGIQRGTEQMEASHILIAHDQAEAAGGSMERTKEEAKQLAQDIAQRARTGEDFAKLAQEYSDGPSGAQGGNLGAFRRGEMVPQFEAAAFAMPEGTISDPVETQFGFHVIRSDKAPQSEPDKAIYDELIISGEAEGKSTSERAKEYVEQMQAGKVVKLEEQMHLRTIFFSLMPTGWKDTALDGKHFRSATVTLDPTTNLPVVQITFDEEGGKIFAELTKNNVNKRIAIFVGGTLVSAPVVQTEITGENCSDYWKPEHRRSAPIGNRPEYRGYTCTNLPKRAKDSRGHAGRRCPANFNAGCCNRHCNPDGIHAFGVQGTRAHRRYFPLYLRLPVFQFPQNATLHRNR